MESESSPLRVPATILTVVLVGYILYVGAFLILPLIIAYLLCKASQPLVTLLRRYHIPAAVTIAILMVLLVTALSWLGGQVYDSAKSYVTGFHLDATALETPITGSSAEPSVVTYADVEKALKESFNGTWKEMDWEKIVAGMKSVVPRLGALLAGAATAVFGVVNQVVLVLFFMLFIFAEQSVSRRKILMAAGPKQAEVAKVLADIDRDVQKYLVAKTGISLTTGLLCFVGLWFLDVPNAALFGFLSFLLNYIPNFGSIVAAIFPVVTAWIHFGSFAVPAAVIVLYTAVNLVFGNVVEPRVFGKQLNLSPLVILVAVIFWSALWGVAGMFLAIPLTRTMQLVLMNIPSLKWVAVLMSNGTTEEA